MRRRLFAALIGSSVTLIACGKEGGNDAKRDGPKPSSTGGKQAFIVEAGDDMKFATTELACKAGSKVEVTIRHTGKMPKASMGHNFVLLALGADPNLVAKAAMDAPPDYIPKGDERILAHTKLVGGGESDTVSFTAPAAGTYTYICTFPGHVTMMQGKLLVS